MKLSTYTGLVIGPLMIGACIAILSSVYNGRSFLANNQEVALALAVGSGIYGLSRLIRSVRALVNREKE